MHFTLQGSRITSKWLSRGGSVTWLLQRICPLLLTFDGGLIFFMWDRDLVWGNLECSWLRSNRMGKCWEMGLRGELFCAPFFFFEETVDDCLMVAPAFAPSWLWQGWGSLPAAGERRGVGGSGGCWSELGPYVRRHPGDWCNMERFSVWWMLSLVFVALMGFHLSWATVIYVWGIYPGKKYFKN